MDRRSALPWRINFLELVFNYMMFLFPSIDYPRASFYAGPIKRMCDAGAIPIAVTNVPELCMWMETSNR